MKSLLKSAGTALVLTMLVSLPIINIASAIYPFTEEGHDVSTALLDGLGAHIECEYEDPDHFFQEYHWAERYAILHVETYGLMYSKFAGEGYLDEENTAGNSEDEYYFYTVTWASTWAYSKFRDTYTKAVWDREVYIKIVPIS